MRRYGCRRHPQLQAEYEANLNADRRQVSQTCFDHASHQWPSLSQQIGTVIGRFNLRALTIDVSG
jgi:hypothetical protein